MCYFKEMRQKFKFCQLTERQRENESSLVFETKMSCHRRDMMTHTERPCLPVAAFPFNSMVLQRKHLKIIVK